MLRHKRIFHIIGVVFIMLILFFVFGTARYRSMKTGNIGFIAFEKKLMQASAAKSEIDISKITDFNWDECYVFPPYFPSKMVYEKVGTEWTTAKTYIEFLISHSTENDTLNDGEFLMVFKKGNKAIRSRRYSINKLPAIFKLDNYKFTRNNSKFLVNPSKQYNDGKVKELSLKNVE